MTTAATTSTANPLRLLRSYLFWTYDRGSIHYDVMVSLILAFLFLGPRFIDFGDKPVATVPLRSTEVLVKEEGDQTELERRAAILRVIEPIAGEVTLDHYDSIRDAKGKIVAYDAWILR
jgi:hypothetical protein